MPRNNHWFLSSLFQEELAKYFPDFSNKFGNIVLSISENLFHDCRSHYNEQQANLSQNEKIVYPTNGKHGRALKSFPIKTTLLKTNITSINEYRKLMYDWINSKKSFCLNKLQEHFNKFEKDTEIEKNARKYAQYVDGLNFDDYHKQQEKSLFKRNENTSTPYFEKGMKNILSSLQNCKDEDDEKESNGHKRKLNELFDDELDGDNNSMIDGYCLKLVGKKVDLTQLKKICIETIKNDDDDYNKSKNLKEKISEQSIALHEMKQTINEQYEVYKELNESFEIILNKKLKEKEEKIRKRNKEIEDQFDLLKK
jgi:hypothetical protein